MDNTLPSSRGHRSPWQGPPNLKSCHPLQFCFGRSGYSKKLTTPGGKRGLSSNCLQWARAAGGLPGEEQYRGSWEGQQNTWQLGLRGQRGLAFGFPSLLWILFWGLSLRRTRPLSLGLGRNPGILNGGGW